MTTPDRPRARGFDAAGEDEAGHGQGEGRDPQRDGSGEGEKVGAGAIGDEGVDLAIHFDEPPHEATVASSAAKKMAAMESQSRSAKPGMKSSLEGAGVVEHGWRQERQWQDHLQHRPAQR